ncbi:hypothetical protein BGZ65_005667 [Modicella reniformis]|uniref:Uncharacterized protein n=1 Tax=Modicella reniformis TaxID=1440133 RepID=A0A9P6IXI1_9FUNG|nr:hypothetical protein BGZ65_005667 [Modicella reniformis]
MEAQHVVNPWLQQQQQQQHLKTDILFSNDPSDSPLVKDTETKSLEDHKKFFYQTQQLLLQLRQQQEQQKSDDYRDLQEDDDDETDSQRTVWTQLGMDSPLNQSSTTLGDSATVLCLTNCELEEDVLEKLVQTLQPEVEDTRATVLELESKLNLAEHSNQHIVEELKMLLADAEVTLRNRALHRKGTTSDEDSNVVYNRICIALQQLIDEAQHALQKSSAAKSSFSPGDESRSSPCEESSSSEWSSALHDRTPDCHQMEHDLPRRRPRDSLTLFNLDKVHKYPDDANQSLSSSPTSFYSATDEVSRIYWKQKHEEQHDRYRKSCHRLTLELDGSFQNLGTDSDDSETSLRQSRHPKSSESSSAQSTAPSTPTTPTPTVPLQGILRSSKKDGSKRERLKKKYQVQFLNPDIPESNRRDSGVSITTAYRHRQSQRRQQQQQQQQKEQQLQLQRQFTSRSVGSTRSRGVLLQLYDLWQHTWLRTRIMHVITGSVEIIIIIWVVIKASRLTLTWLGIQPSTLDQWMSFIYGHRETAGASAKELYEKIRKDGLLMRQIDARNVRIPEALVEDLVAGAAASTGLITPKIVYGPAKRIVAHAVTGVALAFLSDGARRLVRKL